MAYSSDESGQFQVYVRPFPQVDGGRWQVSTNGGRNPLWSPDGRGLLYLNADAVMAVSIKTDPAFSLDAPRILFQGTFVGLGLGSSNFSTWDISPDGKRFLMIREAGTSASASGVRRPISVVLNWLEELKQRVPDK